MDRLPPEELFYCEKCRRSTMFMKCRCISHRIIINKEIIGVFWGLSPSEALENFMASTFTPAIWINKAIVVDNNIEEATIKVKLACH